MTDDIEPTPAGGWSGPATWRITPQSSAFQAAASSLAKLLGRKQTPNIFRMLQRNPRLFWPWLAFAAQLMPFGRIAARDRERVILRVAWNCRSRYEWVQHVDISRRLGMPREELLWIADGPEHPGWDEPCRTLLAACDELHAGRCLLESTWQALARRYDQPTLLELLMLIGHYEMLAGVLNTTGVPLESELNSASR